MEKSDFNYQTFYFVRKEKSRKKENLTRSTQLNASSNFILHFDIDVSNYVWFAIALFA